MAHTPYSQFASDELILRDHLAMDRTIMANERTFLAYIRTGLGLFAAGVSLLQFFPPPLLQIAGWMLIPAGVITISTGLMRYRKMKGLIEQVREK